MVGRIVVCMMPRCSSFPLRIAVAVSIAVLLIVGPLPSAGAFGPGEAAEGTFASDRIVVGFKRGTKAWDMAGAHAAAGTKAKGHIPPLDVEIVEVPKGRTVPGLIKMYEKNPNVTFAEPDYVVTAQMTPDDPYYQYQWGLPAVNAPAAWETVTGSSDVTIAVLDTGIDASHPDFAGRIVAGYDFVNGDANPDDDHGHGTTVAGIAGANGNNSLGVAGVDWQARLMPVKVLSASGSGYLSDVAQGIVWATDHGAQVINMSLSGSSGSSVLAQAVDYAYGRGTTLVAGSGNNGTDTIGYPAVYPKVIAVGALNKELLATFSNYGSGLSLVAPGYGIYTTLRGGGYVKTSGTSMSTPFVAGLAAVMYGHDPSLSPAEVEGIMRDTATDLGDPGFDIYFGYGRIDMARALAALTDGQPAPAPMPDLEPVPEPEPAPDPTPSPEPEPAPEPTPAPGPEAPPAPAPVDTTAPTVRITSPADGSTVSGNVAITAAATDDTGVTRVHFYANGGLIGKVTTQPYSVRWNTRKLSGTYTLTAIAYDAAGNTSQPSVLTVKIATATTGKPPKK
jgi:subtilisin family serine protease